MCSVKVIPWRLTLSYIPTSHLVIIKYTTNLEKGNHSSGSLVSAGEKKEGGEKKRKKKRWNLEVGTRPL